MFHHRNRAWKGAGEQRCDPFLVQLIPTSHREGTEDGWVPAAQPWTLPRPWLDEISIPMAGWGMNEAAGQEPGRGSHLGVVGVQWLHHHLVVGGPELGAGEALC